jgi:hypothetical protein
MFKKLSFVFVGLFILAILPFVGCVEASSEFWSKTFGGDDMDACRAMVQTSDGGFAMLGFAHSFSTGSFLIKTNADGNLEWHKTNAVRTRCLFVFSDLGWWLCFCRHSPYCVCC